MIGIKLEGDSEYLQTKPDTSIDMVLENPLLNNEKLSPGSYSFPFTIPVGNSSGKNAQKLTHPDVIENNASYQTKKVELSWNDIPFKPGNLRVQSIVENQASTYLTFGLSTIDDSIKTAKLREVVAQQIIISNTVADKAFYIKKIADPMNPSTPGAFNWRVTINGVEYGGSGTSVAAFIEAINDEGLLTLDTGKHVPMAVLITDGNSPGGLEPDYVKISNVKWLTLFNPETETMEPTPVASGDPLQELSISADPETYLFDWEIPNYWADFNALLSDPEFTSIFKFPVRFNNNAYGDTSVLKKTNWVNYANSTTFFVNFFQGGEWSQPVNRNSLQPFILLKCVLDKIADAFNFSWEGDFYDHADLETFLIDNTAGLDQPLRHINDHQFVFWRRTFNLSELVPDMTVVDFLNAIKLRYNLGIYWNEVTGKVRMCFREPIAKRIVYDDITRYTSPVQKIEDLSVTGFKIVVTKEDSDALSTDESIDIGTPEENISVPCGRIQNEYTQQSTLVIGQPPALVTGLLVSAPFGSKFGLRLFHYSGTIEVSPGQWSYHKGSISSAGFYEPLVSDGDDIGLYDAFWKYWLHYQRGRKLVSVKVNYPFRMLRQIDWELKRRFDRNNYLIKSIRVRLSNQKVSVSDVELYTMK